MSNASEDPAIAGVVSAVENLAVKEDTESEVRIFF